ncbi:hypothetical protein [Candidatus Accumulibacter contiguus]|uniref:hypothetical protein n=1 Tax=Candidatus Accumulibacter contiguus TaxID=2954381 RepID=UPI002FC28F14
MQVAAKETAMGDFGKLMVAAVLPGVFRVLAGLSMVIASSVAQAALTDISDAPFYNSTSSQLKPNIMLLMDTSNSMRFSHMPDQIEGTNSGLMPIGYKSYQCNILYYNPNRVYEIPKDSSGNPLPTPVSPPHPTIITRRTRGPSICPAFSRPMTPRPGNIRRSRIPPKPPITTSIRLPVRRTI